MSLISRFQSFVSKDLGIAREDTFLLAVSGGRDSMLMAHLFRHLGYKCVIAHCNFLLRGDESDKDENLVCSYANEHGMPYYVKRFETESYALQEGISIQMAARDLRYAWFRELKEELGLSWICIAQHLNDHVETFFVNLIRGTGLAGLRGILPKRNDLLRPLLFLTAEEVLFHVKEFGVPFRDDQSNFSTKYARNKVRLDIVPKFKEIVNDFEYVMESNIQHLQESYELLQSFVEPIRESIFVKKTFGYEINRNNIGHYQDNQVLIYELFKPFGFSKEVLSDMWKNWEGEVGKIYHSTEYSLLMDRQSLFLQPRLIDEDERFLILSEIDASWVFGGFLFSLSSSESLLIEHASGIAQVDAERLIFPLELRYWKEGDYFYPLGMGGRQKISDFFIHQKIDRFTKERIPILVNSNGEIIWVVNYRLDNRYKITESTKKVVKLVCK